jgi:hypothetical protein
MEETFTSRCFLCNEAVRYPVACPGCDAIYCCSRKCLKHRDQRHDPAACRRMKSSLAAMSTLYSNMPFPWYPKYALPSQCTLLKELGVHGKGAFVRECQCLQSKAFGLAAPLLGSLWKKKTTSTGSDAVLDRATLIQNLDDYSWWAGAAADGIHLLSTSLSTTSSSPTDLDMTIDSWESYCTQRQVPLTSPLAILLDMPLTVYWAVQKLKKQRGGNLPRKINIALAGVEKEIDQWPLFIELSALLPNHDIVLHFIGPEIPSWADTCSVTVPHVGGSSYSTKMHFHAEMLNSVMTTRVHQLDVLVGLNAGLGAYPTWLMSLCHAMQLMQTSGKPEVMLFTDYINESIWISKQNCNAMLEHINRSGRALALSESEINPFRKPAWIKQTGHSMPCCPNGFGFWITPR